MSEEVRPHVRKGFVSLVWEDMKCGILDQLMKPSREVERCFGVILPPQEKGWSLDRGRLFGEILVDRFYERSSEFASSLVIS